ncbi:MAG TPA: aldo/keto reductase [Beijerinckiaceae bacterium]|nr:aldo/keto reductase [Beijerinckiaceae bacterium]
MDQIIVAANGARIPAIGLGTWQLTGEVASAAVAHALRCGYRHIDTAAAYTNEEAVGQGLRASGIKRDDVFVTTKVWWDSIDDGALQASAEASLKRLGLEQVDLLLIHWPNPAIPLARSIKALNEVKRSGLARHIGVSNFPVALLDEAVRLSTEPLVANQCEYQPLLDQSKVIAACRRHGMAFVSYTPIGRGKIDGTGPIADIARRHSRTVAQVILRWHLQQGLVAIPRSSNPGRIAENFAVWDFALDAADMAAISGLARPDGRIVNIAWAPAWD